jgi:hypothetical protein
MLLLHLRAAGDEEEKGMVMGWLLVLGPAVATPTMSFAISGFKTPLFLLLLLLSLIVLLPQRVRPIRKPKKPGPNKLESR